MDRKYLMDWVEADRAVETSTTTLPQALASIHDIVHFAARAKHDVTIVCGSLSHSLRDDLTTRVTGVTFGQSLQELLEAGGSVRLFLANKTENDGPLAASLRFLLNEYDRPKFQIDSSEDDAFNKQFPHFAIAHKGQEASLIRVEAMPHEPLIGTLEPSTEVPGILIGPKHPKLRDIGRAILALYESKVELDRGESVEPYPVLC